MSAWISSNTFQQKYRVFSSAFWDKNESAYDLEKSDRIVLPQSALTALTDCNAPLPVLLKIALLDTFSNKPLPSNQFAYVIDYSAPDGMMYMSSWMISKLGLDPSGQSIVELALPTTNDLTYQCPLGQYIQLQPSSMKAASAANVKDELYQSLSEHYSCLHVGDVVSVHREQQTLAFTVTQITDKPSAFAAKVVRLSNDGDAAALPLKLELLAPVQQNNDDHKEQDAAAAVNEDSDAFEWEIVSVEKVKSLQDLEWVEPAVAADSKATSEEVDKEHVNAQPPPPIDDNKIDDAQAPKPNSQIDSSDAKVQEEAKKEEAVVYTEWLCPQCNSINETAYKFCPKCGCTKESWKPPPQEQQQAQPQQTNPNNNVLTDAQIHDVHTILLKNISVINDGTFTPSERRSTGWIVKNISGQRLDIKAKLLAMAGDSDVTAEYESAIRFEMNVDDEMYILLTVTAPQIPQQYHLFYQLVLVNDEKKRICDMLQLPVKVESPFSKEKEEKIKQIFQMGFKERETIITALKKWNWDALKAVNWLATH